MADGKLNGQKAFMSGKLKVKGNIMLATSESSCCGLEQLKLTFYSRARRCAQGSKGKDVKHCAPFSMLQSILYHSLPLCIVSCLWSELFHAAFIQPRLKFSLYHSAFAQPRLNFWEGILLYNNPALHHYFAIMLLSCHWWREALLRKLESRRLVLWEDNPFHCRGEL